MVFVSGWYFQPLFKILVSWGYYSQYMKKMFQTTNQLYVCFGAKRPVGM